MPSLPVLFTCVTLVKFFLCLGTPLTERQFKGSTNIKILNEEDIEGMRVAGRVRIMLTGYS